jgi:hypothetical protein
LPASRRIVDRIPPRRIRSRGAARLPNALPPVLPRLSEPPVPIAPMAWSSLSASG